MSARLQPLTGSPEPLSLEEGALGWSWVGKWAHSIELETEAYVTEAFSFCHTAKGDGGSRGSLTARYHPMPSTPHPG